jgi:hypothetical protein
MNKPTRDQQDGGGKVRLVESLSLELNTRGYRHRSGIDAPLEIHRRSYALTALGIGDI